MSNMEDADVEAGNVEIEERRAQEADSARPNTVEEDVDAANVEGLDDSERGDGTRQSQKETAAREARRQRRKEFEYLQTELNAANDETARSRNRQGKAERNERKEAETITVEAFMQKKFRAFGNDQHEGVIGCCLGSYKEIWYKLKRFENLSLLNLYYYQHQLITLDSKIFGLKGERRNSTQQRRPLTFKEWQQLSKLLRDYQTALQQFKATSQQQRPAEEARVETNERLSGIFQNKQYSDAWDGKSYLDIGPEALKVEPDRGRAMIRRLMKHSDGTIGFSDGSRSMSETEETPRFSLVEPDAEEEASMQPMQGRRTHGVLQHLKTPTKEHAENFVVAVVAGLSLLAPMVALTYIKNRGFILLATCLFVLAFAFLVSMFIRASSQEVMIATATYAAVLVVFVGQSTQTMT